ncbi:MAG TPA: hypothetical protein VE753_10910 [Gaiellaceae bacterium]|nr:hypothetical protein [Gaiellaceae bacterium]
MFRSQPVLVSYSDDGGESWRGPIQATDEQPDRCTARSACSPLVLPNGDVVIVYADAQPGALTPPRWWTRSTGRSTATA